ncbi:MAG: DNA internalization-related competence protein ComEC/Rec2 [Nitrospirota bacterium]|nr:DNA internalization-related competence protein ComEC/Rec2 [Nitrospirota bacterium]
MCLPTIAAFLLGVCLGSFLPFLPFTILSLVIFGAIGLVVCERHGLLSVSQGCVLFATVLVGIVFWSLDEQIHSGNALQEFVGPAPVLVQGVIAEPVQHSPGRLVMLVDVTTAGEEPQMRSVHGLLRLTWRGSGSTVYRGDEIQVNTRVRAPFGTKNPGGFDYGAYLTRQGIDAVATVKGPEAVQVLSRESGGAWVRAWHRIDVWRDQIRQAALSTLEGAALGLYLGMIVGEQSYISPEVRDHFMTTGTVHILSISGSHLGLLAILSFWFVQRVSRRLPTPWIERLSCWMTSQQFAALATVPLVLFYTAISGAQVATVRSLFMILLYLLGVWLGHERHLLIALGISALFVTLSDPMALYDISFQLSYGSVLAIALAFQWWTTKEEEQENIPSGVLTIYAWIKPYVMISLAVTIATMPLVAYYFNQIAWLGIFSNMLVVPMVGVLFVPLGILSAIGVLLADQAQLPFSWVLQKGLDMLSVLVGKLASIPGAEWHVASPAPFAMIGFYVGLGVIMVCRRKRVQAMAAVLLMGLAFWWAWSPQSLWHANRMRVTFLDVGQGDATLIELPDRQTILIDGGAAYERWDIGRMVVAPYLWDQGIRHVDHVIATHPQLDHVGGLAWVVKKFTVGQFWDNGMEREQSFYLDLEEAVRNKNLADRVAWEGQDLLQTSSCHLYSFNPRQLTGMQATETSSKAGSFNNRSVVLKLTCGQQSFLFPADVEIPTLGRFVQEDTTKTARVVKIPHHGAKSSFHRSWIKQLQGEVAVVSAGRGNRYGHPAEAVLRAYVDQGFQVFRTDRDGAVWIDADVRGASFSIHTSQERELRKVFRGGTILLQEVSNLKRLWDRGRGYL